VWEVFSLKKIMITGATDGIGRETAKKLADKGHNLIIHGRSRSKVDRTIRELKNINPDPDYFAARADLSSQKEVIELSDKLNQEHQKLNVLINNAGTYQKYLQLTEDGIEKTLAVNYHSHFILTLLLIDLIKKAEDARIINVSSMVHAPHIDIEDIWEPEYFDGSSAYSDSKLCNILFTFKLADIMGDEAAVNCLHPGVINTKLLKRGWGGGGRSTAKGAETSVYLAAADEASEYSGSYFVNKKKKEPSRAAHDKELQDELWQKSIEKISYDIEVEKYILENKKPSA